MAQLVDYQPWHLWEIDVQPAQKKQHDLLRPGVPESLVNYPCYSVLSDDGRVLGVGGLIHCWDGRGSVWSYLARDLGNQFVTCHRAAQALVNSVDYPRLEMSVAIDHDDGHRWAQMLGFKCETPFMEKYFPYEYGHAAMYVRIKP